MPYRFRTTCVNSSAEKIDAMTDAARDICYATFVSHVPRPELEAAFPGYDWTGEGVGLTLKNDYHVSYHRSVYDDRCCVYAVWSAIEFVFTEN